MGRTQTPDSLHDTFQPEPLPHWNRYLVGNATHEQTPDGIRLRLDDADADQYHDSQLDDFHDRARDQFLWRPPVDLSVRARFSHPQAELKGTAGFGWWNAPFVGGRATNVDIAPQVLWFFFGSPPSNLAATPAWQGSGWVAQGMNIPTLPGWLVRAGMFTLRLPLLKSLARRTAGTVARAAEHPLPHLDLRQWHGYRIEWRAQHADFFVDDNHILRYPSPPPGPLALVLWMDNQWANTEGDGGLLPMPGPQWLELADLHLEPAP
jgi:hypothetical protein